MADFSFAITPEVLNLGVRMQGIRIKDVHNCPDNPEFEDYKSQKLEEIAKYWQDKDYKTDSILQGFRDLHTKVGRSNRDYVASPENLVARFVKKGYFAHINTVVDIYNLVSLESRLALGAHDIKFVQGNITLKFTTGTENFVPLGSPQPVQVFPGEYAYTDDGNNIVCRLEVLQVEPTKVTVDSQDIFFIIQGNAQTPYEYVEKYTRQLIELINKYCGGEAIYLNQLKPV